MTVLLVVHVLACIVLVGVVLMQRSEGGALGIGGGGGGGGGGGLMSGGSSGGALLRTTIIFGAIFFITSLGLTTLVARNSDPLSDVESRVEEERGVLEDFDAPLLDEPDTDSPTSETEAPAPVIDDPVTVPQGEAGETSEDTAADKEPAPIEDTP